MQFLQSWKKLQRLVALLGNVKAYLTGGSLRDLLLGLMPQELDLAIAGDVLTLARNLAQRLQGTAFALGRKPHVTYRVLGGGYSLDLWPLATDLPEDARRRDFTVNALFFALPSGPLLDFFGGLEDLSKGRLEVIRKDNLQADPIRVLRALRLTLTRPLKLTPRSQALVQEAAPGLQTVARERIREELGKMLMAVPLPTLWQGALALGVWQGLGVFSEPLDCELLGSLSRLEDLKKRPGPWGQAARSLLWASFCLPGLSTGEKPEQALSLVLPLLGVEGKLLRRLLTWVKLGENLKKTGNIKAQLAPAAPQRAPLVWWFLRDASLAFGQLAQTWRWWYRFSQRPPLLPAEEVVALLHLPPGPERGRVLAKLRQLQACGKLRSCTSAKRFLLNNFAGQHRHCSHA